MTSTRKPGAQKGNKNALKHGIYTKFIAVIDDEEMSGMDAENLADELALARVRLKHSLEMESSAADADAKIKWHQQVRADLETIMNIKTRPADKRATEASVWTSLMDAIRDANDRQHVKR